jgi:hypothetical protein
MMIVHVVLLLFFVLLVVVFVAVEHHCWMKSENKEIIYFIVRDRKVE